MSTIHRLTAITAMTAAAILSALGAATAAGAAEDEHPPSLTVVCPDSMVWDGIECVPIPN